jgi:hypothetical protein
MRPNNPADLVNEVDRIELPPASVFETLPCLSDINFLVNAWPRGGCAGPVQGRIPFHRGRTPVRSSDRTLRQTGTLRKMCVGPASTVVLAAQSYLAASTSKAATLSRTSNGRSESNELQGTVAEAVPDAIGNRVHPCRAAPTRIELTSETSGIAR